MTILSDIQYKLKAPKNQYNAFGKYHYRSCEDILEALKPLLAENAHLIINDNIMLIGERYYVKATAILLDSDSKVIAETTAFAREADSKKGMDPSQVTGAASSYARKYALNGMFLIDDTKDADAMHDAKNNGAKSSKPAQNKPSPEVSFESAMNDIRKTIGDENFFRIMGNFGFTDIGEITDRDSQVDVYKEMRANV